MKHTAFTLLTLGLLALPAAAGTSILTDNFNAPDSASLDASDLSGGRMGGLLGSTVQLRSSLAQHGITMGNLRILRGANEPRIRFHDIAGLARHNWASGPEAATITGEGGMRIEFDWQSANITDTNWIEVSVGISTADPNQRVNEAGTDLGILFRNNGTAGQAFIGAAGTAGTAMPAAMVTPLARHVVITYAFTSWADTSPVTANAWVDGFQVITNKAFTWNNNPSGVFIEFGANNNGNLIDNFSISTLGADADTDTDGLPDAWENAHVGNLSDLGTDPGTGAGTVDFDADLLTNAQEYALSRARSWSGISPALADSDGDGLSDNAEANPTAPRLVTNPTRSDTDGDGAGDNAENGTGDYVDLNSTGTNSQLVDTDLDFFPDGYEALRGGNPMAVGTGPANLPAGVSIGIVTDEASTGLSTSETFTHKMSGGAGTTINSVALDVLNTTVTPVNFTWDGGVGGKSIIGPAINNGNATTGWSPTTGGVTGTGNLTMFGTFSFSGNGGTFYARQRFTLSGLEPGRAYEYRLFIRKWDNSTVRPSDVKLINGAETKNVFTLLDRPAIMTGSGNTETAYYIRFDYVAAGPSVVIETMVPRIPASNGSHHMYGMTNRVAGPPADTDADLLSDIWEMQWAGNLADLTGLATGPGPGTNTGDFDDDGLSDAAEYALFFTYSTLSPIDADSDDDGLKDGPELAGAGQRPPTIPTDADSDDDTLTDFAENNSGTYASGTETGTNPRSPDSDNDSFGDAEEIALGTNPNSALSRTPLPSGVTLSVLTDDNSTGIINTPTALATYTHKVSGGGAATINGLVFDVLTDALTPANVLWETGAFTKSIIAPINNGDWAPATGGVTGPGLLDLLGGFTYSGTGANAGSTQRFTLSGLTPGLTYEARLYIRVWDTEGSGRPIDLKFTNGAEVAQIWPGHWLPMDRPGGVTTTGNAHAAYALSFTYVAAGNSLVIDANVPAGAVAASGSFHMYGMTNRTAGPPPVLDFNSITRAPNGASTTLDVKSRPGRTYVLFYSTDLVTWTELGDLTSTGTSTIFVDSIASNFLRTFYRVDDVTPP